MTTTTTVTTIATVTAIPAPATQVTKAKSYRKRQEIVRLVVVTIYRWFRDNVGRLRIGHGAGGWCNLLCRAYGRDLKLKGRARVRGHLHGVLLATKFVNHVVGNWAVLEKCLSAASLHAWNLRSRGTLYRFGSANLSGHAYLLNDWGCRNYMPNLLRQAQSTREQCCSQKQ